MILPLYLAMTAGEFATCARPPKKAAWMACHFSTAHKGLSNLPQSLPEGSILMVDDWNPLEDHDFEEIAAQLKDLLRRHRCAGVVLDFQRPASTGLSELCRYLTATLPCPIAATEVYARDLSSAVFLSAPKLRTPLKRHLEPWQGREIWLEATLNAEEVLITESGCQTKEGSLDPLPEPWHKDSALHCRYHWRKEERALRFLLQRQKEDLFSLLEEAAAVGVTTAVGLYQQLK